MQRGGSYWSNLTLQQSCFIFRICTTFSVELPEHLFDELYNMTIFSVNDCLTFNTILLLLLQQVLTTSFTCRQSFLIKNTTIYTPSNSVLDGVWLEQLRQISGLKFVGKTCKWEGFCKSMIIMNRRLAHKIIGRKGGLISNYSSFLAGKNQLKIHNQNQI